MSLSTLISNFERLKSLPPLLSQDYTERIHKLYFKQLTVICTVLLKPPHYNRLHTLWHKLGNLTSETQWAEILTNTFETSNLNLGSFSPPIQDNIFCKVLSGQPLNIKELTLEVLTHQAQTTTSSELQRITTATNWLQETPTFNINDFKLVSLVLFRAAVSERNRIAEGRPTASECEIQKQKRLEALRTSDLTPVFAKIGDIIRTQSQA